MGARKGVLMRWFLCIVVPVAAFLAAALLLVLMVPLRTRPDFGPGIIDMTGDATVRAMVIVASLKVQSGLILLFFAFSSVAVAAIVLSHAAAARIEAQDGRVWAGLLGLFAVVGALLVALDPVGPLLGCDVRLDSPCGIGTPGLAAPFAAAVAAGVVEPRGALVASGLILGAGALAGALVAAVLLYFSTVARPDRDPEALARRKQGFMRMSAFVSVALSLGVATIDTFLGWSVSFLDGEARATASELASIGTTFWGTAFALFSLLAAGTAAYALNRDIEEAVPPDQPAPEWRRERGLDFEPLKAAAATIAALGPVLTSSVLAALSSLG